VVVQVFVTTTPVTEAARFVPQIVKALCNMPEDCKRHFRLVYALKQCPGSVGSVCFGFLGSGIVNYLSGSGSLYKQEKSREKTYFSYFLLASSKPLTQRVGFGELVQRKLI
jgi:hypothetical protein